jgi:hypothetical protein
MLMGLLEAAETPAQEWLIVSGGPATKYNELQKEQAHDKYWGNFIDKALIRFPQIKQIAKPDDKITWLVYRKAYVSRGEEMRADLISKVVEHANQIGVYLVWFDDTHQLIHYLNSGQDRKIHPIGSFDYFGHSNKSCFLFDYSNMIDGMSVVFLHQNDLKQVKKESFTAEALCQSWGCHSGESFSRHWKEALGVPLIGAIGKTDYSTTESLPNLSSPQGKWSQ